MSVEIVEKVEKVEKKVLCDLKIERDLGCVKLHIKSPLYEQFFKRASKDARATGVEGRWSNGMTYYNYDKASLPREEYSRSLNIRSYGVYDIIDPDNCRYDFSFVKTVGIGDGITIEVPGMFMNEELEAFSKDFTKFTKQFFINYAKKASFEIKITATI